MGSKTLPFAKYSGNGNDFIIVTEAVTGELVQQLCNRNFGVGADGVLTLTPKEGTDGEMRIYNADGGEAEMCGNGLRCLVTYIDDFSKSKKDSYIIKTMNSLYTVVRAGNSFAIEMSEIKDKNLHDLSGFRDFEKCFFINTGVPHLVFLGSNIKSIDIKKTAPQYRFNSLFPGGTNVSLVEVQDANKQSAYVRTYERGVEDETHSCGTGLTATGLALSEWFGWKNEINLTTKGGLQIVNVGAKILYSGEVTRCFRGEIDL